MENFLVKNSSPTLLGEMLKERKTLIKAACELYRCKNASLSIIFTTSENTDTEQVILLRDLPEELRQAFHNLATRCIAESHLIERELRREGATA